MRPTSFKLPLLLISLLAALAGPRLGAAPVINSVSSNTNRVGRYAKLELTVDLTAVYTNAYNPDDVDLWGEFTAPAQHSFWRFWRKSPAPKVWRVNGFYDGAQWKLRFAPDETGRWRYVVRARDAGGTGVGAPEVFTCVPSTNHGWIRSAPNHRYLVHDDGTSFYGVGACYPWGNTSAGLDQMRALGFNVYVYWNGTYDRPGGTNLIESLASGLGRYDQQKCRRLDQLINMSEARGLGMILVIWPHDYLSEKMRGWPSGWAKNPFQTLTPAGAFYGDTNAWAYQQKMYRYIIARWGYSPALAAWQTVDEISGTSGWRADRDAANAWAARMAGYFQTQDPFQHPTTASHGDFWDPGNRANDWPNTEIYGNYSLTNIVSTIHKLWDTYEKPCIMGEVGLDRNAELAHRKIWAGLASGISITPLLWSFNQGWAPGVSTQYAPFEKFIAGIDFARLSNPAPAQVQVPGASAYGITSRQLTFGWLTGEFTGKNLQVTGLSDGAHRLEWWDCTTGDVLATHSVNIINGSLSAPIPPTPRPDLAFKILPP
jgi:hypothetical protein